MSPFYKQGSEDALLAFGLIKQSSKETAAGKGVIAAVKKLFGKAPKAAKKRLSEAELKAIMAKQPKPLEQQMKETTKQIHERAQKKMLYKASEEK